MATRNEQVKPLSTFQLCSDEVEDAKAKQFNYKVHRRRYLQFGGCLTALLIIPAVVIIVIFTAFQIKNPDVKVDAITIQWMHLVNNSNGTSGSSQNIRAVADISVKNPNVASFRFRNTTNTIYYGGIVVGEGQIPPGLSKAKQTLRMNVSLDIIPKKLLSVPSFTDDMRSGVLNITTYTRIHGKVKILKIIKNSVVVKMNCSVSYNILGQAAVHKCKHHG